jgi:hypothetical protein
MREGDQVHSMILGPVLIIRKFPSCFYVVLLAALKSKNHKKKLWLPTLLYFGFVNLRAIGT